jgi:hypothetical protein
MIAGENDHRVPAQILAALIAPLLAIRHEHTQVGGGAIARVAFHGYANSEA